MHVYQDCNNHFSRKRREEFEYEIYDALNITDYAYAPDDWETTTEGETTESISIDWSGTVKFENDKDVKEVNRKRADADPKTGLQGMSHESNLVGVLRVGIVTCLTLF